MSMLQKVLDTTAIVSFAYRIFIRPTFNWLVYKASYTDFDNLISNIF